MRAKILLDENQPEVRDYAAAQTIEVGMADMSETFRAKGGEIYLKRGGVMYQPDFPCVPFRLGLYPVVDSVAWIERLLACGVRTIQLRMDKRDDEVEADVVAAIALGRRYDARLFINDYWRLAVKHRATVASGSAGNGPERYPGRWIKTGVSTTWRSTWRWRLALRTSHLAMFFRRRPNRCPLPHRG